MSMKCVKSGVIVLLCMCCIAFADRTLEKAEILDIFNVLTSQPKEVWISAGTIEAIHDEYRAAKTTNQNEIDGKISLEIEKYQNSTNKTELTKELQEMMLAAIPFNVRYEMSNEYSMNSYVVLKYDGERFYWQISVNSRTDSVTPDVDLKDNYMTEQFNMNWNADRVFAWDGQKFTIYSLSVNNAVVDTSGDFPDVINGPLNAGIIPWGSGNFTYDALSASETSAIEINLDGRTEIQLTIDTSDGTKMHFALDPAKKYAVLSCLFTGRDYIVARQYDNYTLVSGNWVPKDILVEKYDNSATQLLSSDFWKITKISGETPSSGSFSVDYASNALISYHTSTTQPQVAYNYTGDVDIRQPLAGRLDWVRTGSTMPQNCATAALGYAAYQLKKEITTQQMTKLVVGPDKTTSMYAMKQSARELGFYCRAVKTDLKTLKDLSGSKAILHIPGRNHFVFLDHIDNQYVWLVDLTSNKFFYSVDIDVFSKEWTEGIALLVSKQPIELQSNSVEIADAGLHRILGAGEGSTCTLLLQEFDVIECDWTSDGCSGYYTLFFTRYGCETADSGACQQTSYMRKAKILCVDDPYNYGSCTIVGDWTIYYMDACK